MDNMNDDQYWQEERQYSSSFTSSPNDSISSCNPTMMNELQSHQQQHTATMVHPSHYHSYHPQMNNQSMDGSMAIWNGPPAAGYYNAQHMHHQQHMYHPTAKQNQYDHQPMPPPPYRGHHHGIPGHFIFHPGPPPKSSSTHRHHRQQQHASGHHQMSYAPLHVSSSYHHYGAPYHCPPPSHQYHHRVPQMHHPYQHRPHPGMPPSSYSFEHSSTQHDVPPQSSHAPEQSQHVMTSLQQPILTHDKSSTALPSNTAMLPPKTPGKTYSTIKRVTPRTILKKKKSSSTDGIFSSNKMSSSSTPDNMSSTTTSPTPSMTYLNGSSCDNTSPPSNDNVASSKGSVSFSPQVQYHYPNSDGSIQEMTEKKKDSVSDGMLEEKRDELSPVDAIFAAGKLVSFHICSLDILFVTEHTLIFNTYAFLPDNS